MSKEQFFIQKISHSEKWLVGVFLLVLSTGYFSALTFVNNTTSASPQGIVENYNGNEENEEAETMKFKKSGHEMLNIIHTHILSMSVIFFILGLLVSGCDINARLKLILMIEPMLSVMITFSGIYFIWLGHQWMTYIVMISGFLMSTSFAGSVVVVMRELWRG